MTTPMNLNAKAIKVTLVLTPAEVAAIQLPPGGRTVLTIVVDGHKLSADVAVKSLRKAQTVIAEHGPEGTATIIQGKLVGNSVTEAGLVAQPKLKPATAVPEAAG